MEFGLLALIWGSSFLLMKVGLESLQPLQIATLRIVLGAATIVCCTYATGQRLPTAWRDWRQLAVMGFFLAVLPFTLFAMSEKTIPSALAGIGNATTPLATVLAMLALVPRHRASRRQVVAIVVGFCGVVTIMQPWAVAGRPDLGGFAMAIGGGASYGVGWSYAARVRMNERVQGLAQSAATLVAASVLMVPVFVIGGLASPGGLGGLFTVASPDWLPIAAIVTLGVVGTGLAYILFFDVIAQAGAVVGSTVTYLIPVVSVLLGVLVLHEQLGIWQLVGFAIVLGAAWVINRRP